MGKNPKTKKRAKIQFEKDRLRAQTNVKLSDLDDLKCQQLREQSHRSQFGGSCSTSGVYPAQQKRRSDREKQTLNVKVHIADNHECGIHDGPLASAEDNTGQ